MKANWYDFGDPSVGLMGGVYAIDLGDWIPEDKEHREQVRELLTALHAAMWEPNGAPQFSDECGDCGQPIVDLWCRNKMCPNNYRYDDDDE